ncbi:MAG: radical SAM family heme chaperone HemW [Alphaproteobacteria bacterium]
MPASEPGIAAGRGFGIYVHWPFCRSKCPYCDFNSHVRAAVDHDRWRRALVAELSHFADRTGGETVSSVFFGGGTPSLMPPATVAAVLDTIAARWPVADDIEITLEANPTSVEAANFADLAAAGVNRLSVGVQALDDAALKFLGREHAAGEALAAVRLAMAHVGRVSFDLIYARPGQSLDSWADELRRALAEGPTHLSLYQLTLEPGTAFHQLWRQGKLTPLDDDLQADMFAATQVICAEAGLPAYEVSNHAAPGQASRHNLTYWRYGSYVGVGPGAHGRLGRGSDRRATRQIRLPEKWLAAVAANGHATEADEPIDADTRAAECLMMGLRLAEGLDLATLAAEAGRPWRAALNAVALAKMRGAGYLALDGDRLLATETGRPLLNSLTGALLSG